MTDIDDLKAIDQKTVGRTPTPQAMVFTVLGSYCLETNPLIPTSMYFDILGRVGVNEHAARMTLVRMRDRGYVTAKKSGREAFWSATEMGLSIVTRQRKWTFHERSTLPDPDGVWTIVSFSLPEVRRRDRDGLRQRLAWEGFGCLRDGVWISPGERDVSEIVLQRGDDTSIEEYVDSFVGVPKHTDIGRMIARAWHLPDLLARYQQFLDQWDVPHPVPEAVDALGAKILLITNWRQLARETPLLDEKYLPEGWPAHRCMEVFLRTQQTYEADADRIFAELMASAATETA